VKRLVVATLNPDKLGELARLLDLPDLELASLAAFPGAVAPAESGDTLEQNARIKARAAMAFTGLPALADDTGLEVDALGGRPGVHAARFAGPGARYADNVERLLAELAGVPAERRTARFRTVCLVCFPEGDELLAEGVLEGRILDTPRGDRGFGYDPVFALPDGRSLAELTAEEKNALSHRARAVRDLKFRLAGRMLQAPFHPT
jgi:XTP/dITP diphosphohydrolase